MGIFPSQGKILPVQVKFTLHTGISLCQGENPLLIKVNCPLSGEIYLLLKVIYP